MSTITDTLIVGPDFSIERVPHTSICVDARIPVPVAHAWFRGSLSTCQLFNAETFTHVFNDIGPENIVVLQTHNRGVYRWAVRYVVEVPDVHLESYGGAKAMGQNFIWEIHECKALALYNFYVSGDQPNHPLRGNGFRAVLTSYKPAPITLPHRHLIHRLDTEPVLVSDRLTRADLLFAASLKSTAAPRKLRLCTDRIEQTRSMSDRAVGFCIQIGQKRPRPVDVAPPAVASFPDDVLDLIFHIETRRAMARVGDPSATKQLCAMRLVSREVRSIVNGVLTRSATSAIGAFRGLFTEGRPAAVGEVLRSGLGLCKLGLHPNDVLARRFEIKNGTDYLVRRKMADVYQVNSTPASSSQSVSDDASRDNRHILSFQDVTRRIMCLNNRKFASPDSEDRHVLLKRVQSHESDLAWPARASGRASE